MEVINRAKVPVMTHRPQELSVHNGICIIIVVDSSVLTPTVYTDISAFFLHHSVGDHFCGRCVITGSNVIPGTFTMSVRNHFTRET